MLYVGDCKMAALLTRATIAARHDYYLCPLPATQVPPDVLEADLTTARASGPPQRVERVQPDGTREHLADSYECRETFSAAVDGWAVSELIAAAYRVVETWEEGNLAGSVTALGEIARQWDRALDLRVAPVRDERGTHGEGEESTSDA